MNEGFVTIAEGLFIPEGPVALADGSVLIVEVGGGLVHRIAANGTRSVLADLGGGPNGAAIGPDGALYVCNNGGGYACEFIDGNLRVELDPASYVGGSIQRVDLTTGTVTTLYDSYDGARLLAPNDIVFDPHGGFWFTDHGRSEIERKTYGSLYYAHIDRSLIRRARASLLSPNGIGLSPDGRWLYWTDTLTGRLWKAAIVAPGQLAEPRGMPGEVVKTLPGYQMLDSLAVEQDGRICVGTIVNGGITIFDPTGTSEHLPIDDWMVTNICFGGADGRDVWITAAATGRLLKGRWPRPGLPLAFGA